MTSSVLLSLHSFEEEKFPDVAAARVYLFTALPIKYLAVWLISGSSAFCIIFCRREGRSKQDTSRLVNIAVPGTSKKLNGIA